MKYVAVPAFFVAIMLFAINIYGSFQSLRPDNLIPEVLRFGELDVVISPSEFKQGVKRQSDESDGEFFCEPRVTFKVDCI